MLPVSRDTLLRVVRRQATEVMADVRVLGIDDFAWKRGQRYGTMLCDLERRQVIDLLSDREAGTVEVWLAVHPGIAIVSRDRGGGYGQAASRAAPQAIQVADRWHLMENASAAFLQAVRQSMRCIRKVLTSTAIDPALLTCAERLQYEGFLRARTTARLSNGWPERASLSKRSHARPAGAVSLFATSCAAVMATSFVPASACWSRTSQNSMRSGVAGAEVAPRSGEACVLRVFAAVFASLRNGRRGADAASVRNAPRVAFRHRLDNSAG
jgi:hypothetical protein